MVKLKIDNIEFEVNEGSTVLEVAGAAGIIIPTLCNNDKLEHYSSCMVCMVREKKTGNFLPSCSAFVREGMEIDCSSTDVISLRRKAIELLLSEHRAECEAPCKVVCPAGYNIPLMNRLLIAKDIEGAVNLSIKQIQSGPFMCSDCPGYCENACRRKKIDLPVSIRNLQIYVSLRFKHEEIISGPISTPSKPLKRFTSRIGRLEDNELKEWLKECKGESVRRRDIYDIESASLESENCMHCDCRAVENCRLRDIADDFSLNDPRCKLVNSPIQKKININTGLIFENAKCIKCGLCVRLCEDQIDEPRLCFINRGFISMISEPLFEEFDNILKTKSKEVIDICPTGALSQF
jgi:predicted molibdopterin-dependent oxidoreductase YjgC